MNQATLAAKDYDRSMARAAALVEIEMLVDCEGCTAEFMREQIARIMGECQVRIKAINAA